MNQQALRRRFLCRMGIGAMNLGLGLAYSPSALAEPFGAMLATAWPAQADPEPYWVSEKLDGVRAVWDGQ